LKKSLPKKKKSVLFISSNGTEPATTGAKTMEAIEAGMKATYSVGSDQWPCTVIAVSKSGHKVTVQDDRVTEWSEGKGAKIEADPAGDIHVYTRRSTGRYRRAGWEHSSIWFGRHGAYRDPGF
jgi:hypothetical protein